MFALMFCTGWHDQVGSRSMGQKEACIRGIAAGVRTLLGSILVLTNGLVLLQFGADCLQPRWACRLLPYTDPVFSMVTVLVLIATVVPELQRHALMLLQAAPAHLRVEELITSIGRVPGVLAIHELHVWQLSETRLVASVHIHCPSGLGALQCSELLVMVTEVLKRFGVSHSTVQPEFIAICSNDALAQGSAVPVAATEGTAVQPYCSLRCGKECAKKMCCSPPEEPPCPKTLSTVDEEVRHQDIVIENTYL